MNRFFFLLIALIQNLSAADGAPRSWTWQSALVPDVGFDLDAAEVVPVTNLDADGKGSLREALWKKGPRLIVFNVGDTVALDLSVLIDSALVPDAGAGGSVRLVGLPAGVVFDPATFLLSGRVLGRICRANSGH